jgi:choline dehydrogenase-like flavoprotein
MAHTPLYDAVIVGSGPTGGYAAKTLSEAGMKVLVLDAGRRQRHGNALLRFDDLRRKLGYRIEEDPAAVRRQRVQSSFYAWRVHPHAFVDDTANPYTTDPGRPFHWIRTRQIGGRMLVRWHGLQFYRFSDFDFKAGDRDGASPNWPLSYKDLAPYYDRIEHWIGLKGARDGIAHLPDPAPIGERSLNAGEALLKEAVERRWRDRKVIQSRTAPPPAPIYDALATRRCTLRTDAIASQILIDSATGRATGVGFVDAFSKKYRDVSGRIVVLCASSIESARLLLASSSPRHPQGLANSSGVIGRYLMDHIHLTGINGSLRLNEPIPTSSWSYIPCFRNVTAPEAGFVRGYGIQVFTAWRECGLTVFGETLPHPDNRVTLDADRKDKWGIPIPHIAYANRENERALASDASQTCVEILQSANLELTATNSDMSVPGLGAHEVGTARMGSDPRSSALNSFCQAWDVKNLFVMDGSCFVTQGVQNPTLTMLALAARSCDYLIESYKRGSL